MDKESDQPELHFFRCLPDNSPSRPPLCSSLQNLESAFLLLAMERFPHALVTTASSVESAMKAALNVPSDDRISATELYKLALERYIALADFPCSSLKEFRDTRNRIVHYGFSPRDDETTAELLLKVGLPFLIDCYKEFFAFDLLGELFHEFGIHLRIALDVYQQAKDKIDHFTYCFASFAHLIRRSFRDSHMSAWEREATVHADETGTKFDHCEERKRAIELNFRLPWVFDCPVCDDVDVFVCELDEDRLDNSEVVLKRAGCASCDFRVFKNAPCLADTLCRDQVMRKREEILRRMR